MPRGFISQFAFGLWTCAWADTFDCQSTSSKGFKIAVTSQVNKDLCDLQSPVIDQNTMAQQCTAFCAIEGEDLALPLVVGSTSYGFDRTSINQVCQNTEDEAVIKFDEKKKAFCKEKGTALRNIQDVTANFVAKVDVIKARQTAFQAATASIVAKLREELQDEEFLNSMKRKGSKRPEFLREKLLEFKAEVDAEPTKTSLSDGMEELKTQGNELQATVKRELKAFQEWLSNCNTLLMGSSAAPDKQYLLDVCIQDGSSCIEEEGSSHVGCCCGVNPLILEGSYGIYGESQASRLLAPTESGFDVCAAAKQRSEKDVKIAKDKALSFASGQTLLEGKQAELRDQYPDYGSTCGFSSRRLTEDKASPLAVPDQPVQAFPRASNASRIRSRSLQQLSCTPPKVTDTKGDNLIKVAFTSKTENDLCDLDPVVDYSQMSEQCDQFCGASSVPLLLGSETYGFDLEAVKTILLGDVLKHDLQDVDTCLGDAQAFYEIEKKTSKLVEASAVFTAAKLLYTAETRDKVVQLQEYVSSDEFAASIKRTNKDEKMGKFIAAVKEKMALGADENAALKKLKEAEAGLRDAVEKLNAALTSNIPRLQNFVRNCNQLYVGYGARKEFLLDICVQDGSSCIDESGAVHVSCGCAFNPAVTLGSFLENPITGMKADIEGLHVDRRLEKAGSPSHDICADGWTAAKPAVEGMYADILSIGQQEVLTKHTAKMKSNYGNSYCSFVRSHAGDDAATDDAATATGGAGEDTDGGQRATGALVTFAFSVLVIVDLSACRRGQ